MTRIPVGSENVWVLFREQNKKKLNGYFVVRLLEPKWLQMQESQVQDVTGL